MSDNYSNDSESADLKQTLDCVKQITRDIESLTIEFQRDSAMIATLSTKAKQPGKRNSAQQQTAAMLEGVDQSLARQKALGKQLISDAAVFAEALNRWAQDLEKRQRQQLDHLSFVPSMPVVSGGNQTTEADGFGTPDIHQSTSHDNSGGRPGVLIYTNDWDTYTRYTGDDKGMGQLSSAYVTYVGNDVTNIYLATAEALGAIDPPTYNGVAYPYRVTINSGESWYYYAEKDAQTKMEEGAFIAISSLTPLMLGFSPTLESIKDFVVTAGTINYVPRVDPNIPWDAGIKARGLRWEDYLESGMPGSTRTPPSFKTFDFFNYSTENAVSAKTLDTLTVSRLTNPKQLYQKLVKYIDEAVQFSDDRLLKLDPPASKSNLRIIQVAIPAKTTLEQMQQIDEAIQYGRSQRVIVIVRDAK